MKGTIFQKSRLMFISPWLLTAAVGLLLVIIVVFAANTLQRDRRLLTESLFRKGVDVAKFVGAGIRASVMMGVPGSTQVQHLIEQATEENQSLLYIAVLDSEFKILAHNNQELIGKKFDDLAFIRNEYRQVPTWRIVAAPESGLNTFEVIAPFQPFSGGRGNFMRNRMRQMMNQQRKGAFHTEGDRPDFSSEAPKDWCSAFGNKPEEWPQEGSHTILIGLGMQDLEILSRQNRVNLIIMSAALLFIGLGAWIALLAAQGFRASQNTIQYMQAFTNLLISRLPVGIIATGKNGRIQTCNRTAAEMTGKAAEQIINRKPPEGLPDQFANFFDQVREDEELIDSEVVIEREPLPPSSFHVSSVPVTDEANLITGRVVLIHDLTRLKQLEKDVRRHEQLAALGKMAAGVAHEVRNPLSSIKGFATLLGSRFPEGSHEHATAALMINEVERLNRSITELLNYARPLPLKPVEFDAEETLRNSFKLIESDARELGVTLQYEIAPECRMIYADPDRVNQVLLNLYLNSLQAMAEGGGRLRVSVHQGKNAGTTAITVEDTGSGIPADMLKHILEPYVTTKSNGTGLGLAMVHKIIDEHGGHLEISSEENQGTTVTINLPHKPAHG